MQYMYLINALCMKALNHRSCAHLSAEIDIEPGTLLESRADRSSEGMWREVDAYQDMVMVMGLGRVC